MNRMKPRRPAVPLAFALTGAFVALAATASLAYGDRDGDRGRGRGVAPDQCVSSPLDTTRIVDSRTLYVDDYSGHAVLLHMTSQCLNSFHEAVGIRFVGTSRICDPLDVDVTDSIFTMPAPCMVGSVEALSKDDAKAYRNGK